MVCRSSGVMASRVSTSAQEAQVEHLVGLVEHDHLDVAKVELSLPGEVEQSARGAHDDVDAGVQGLELGLVGAPAVDHLHAHGTVGRGSLQVGRDLQRELARRADHEGLGLAGGREVVVVDLVRADDALQQRQAEGQRLAGAGTRLADHVGSGQGHGDGHLLHREGDGDAPCGQRGDEAGHHAEVGERLDRDLGAGSLGVGGLGLGGVGGLGGFGGCVLVDAQSSTPSNRPATRGAGWQGARRPK